MQLLHLLQQPGALLVQAGVLDRRRRLRREQQGELLVVVGELLRAELLGEVEVAEHPLPADDRHAEEGLHRRMVGWKTVRIGVARQVRETDDARLADHQAEDAVPPRRRRRCAPVPPASSRWS